MNLFCGNSSDICAGQHISKYDGKYYNRVQSLEMILWMGIVAPMAEETIFRWLMYLRLRDYMKIPGGSYHFRCDFRDFPRKFCADYLCGNSGTVMAYILEMSGNRWSSVLLHIGANVFSLILTDAAPKLLALEGTPYAAMANTAILILYGILLAAMLFGIFYFGKKREKAGIGQFKRVCFALSVGIQKTSSVKSFIRKTLDRGVFLMYIHTIPRRGVREGKMKADKKKMTRLLKTARGQMDGILRMMEEDRYCIEISQQLMATEAILNKINKEILTAHLKSCVANAETEEEKEEKIDEFVSMLGKILK